MRETRKRRKPVSQLSPLDQIVNPTDGSGMVRISEGECVIGSDTATPPERPAHRVAVGDFYLAQHPVTNAQYARFILDTGQRVPYLDDPRVRKENWDPERRTLPPGRTEHPVVLVSWRDAQAYCEWAGGRLPTEAEWEKAARGGLVGKSYPWGDEIDRDLANYDSQAGTTPVGSYPANGFGLYDMAGNVWEWVADWYDPQYYSASPIRDPHGPQVGTVKVLRGGAWLLFPEFCRVAYRFRNSPNFRFNLIGFRLAMPL